MHESVKCRCSRPANCIARVCWFVCTLEPVVLATCSPDASGVGSDSYAFVCLYLYGMPATNYAIARNVLITQVK